MREKRPALVITFPTTAAAMGCESLCIERGRLRSGVEGVACR